VFGSNISLIILQKLYKNTIINSHACDRCRKRHVKCDGDFPICGNCKNYNSDCSYSHPGSKRGYAETIDERLSKVNK
jgi:hypothetical protein